jgi:hypothetical protein
MSWFIIIIIFIIININVLCYNDILHTSQCSDRCRRTKASRNSRASTTVYVYVYNLAPRPLHIYIIPTKACRNSRASTTAQPAQHHKLYIYIYIYIYYIIYDIIHYINRASTNTPPQPLPPQERYNGWANMSSISLVKYENWSKATSKMLVKYNQ